MQSRTIITSSLSKVFSVTGWRVGWVIVPPMIASGVRNIHIKITDSAPAPFLEAALTALRNPSTYLRPREGNMNQKETKFLTCLRRLDSRQFKPQGSFFVFAELPESCPLSDVIVSFPKSTFTFILVEFVEELIKQAGVVAVPGSVFFHTDASVERYIRFAFCKSEDTLAAAAEKISGLVDATGCLKLF